MRDIPVVTCIYDNYNKEELVWGMISHLTNNLWRIHYSFKIKHRKSGPKLSEKKKLTAGHHRNHQSPVTEEKSETIFPTLYGVCMCVADFINNDLSFLGKLSDWSPNLLRLQDFTCAIGITLHTTWNKSRISVRLCSIYYQQRDTLSPLSQQDGPLLRRWLEELVFI